MRKSIVKFGIRTSSIGLEFIAVIVGIIFLVAGLMIWRVASGPVDISFADKYIADALHDPATGTDIGLNQATISWPVFKGPLELNLKKVSLERQHRQIISIEDVTLSLSTAHLLLGRIEPTIIRLQRPVLGMIRTSDNKFLLSMRQPQPAAAPSQEPSVNPLQDVINQLMAPKDRKKHTPLSSLKSISIVDATLILEDHYAGLTWYLHPVTFEFGRDKKGLAINVGLKTPGGLHDRSALHLDAIYGRSDGAVRFNLQLEDFDLASGAGKLKDLDFLIGQKLVVNGNLSGVLDKNMALQTLDLALTSETGALDIHGIYDNPLPYQNLQLTASYDALAKKAALRKFQLTTKGVTLQGAGDLAVTPDAATASIKLRIPEILQAQIAPLWPDRMRGEGSEIWLTHKLSEGRATNIDAGFDLVMQRPASPEGPPAPMADWPVNVRNIEGAFDVDNMTVNYREPLTPVKKASGHGIFKNGDLNIDIKGGLIGDINVAGSHVLLANIVHAHEGIATIDVRAAGPLRTVLDYTRDEPINLGPEKLGLKGDLVKGDAAFTVQVNFPTIRDLKADQVKVKLDGTLNNILLPGIVENLDLTGGPFKLEIADAAAKLNGTGKLDGHDINVQLQQYLHAEDKPFATRINASMKVDDALRAKFGVGLTDWLNGTFPTDIIYTVNAVHKATVDVKADLTPGTLMVGPFNYSKPPGQAGDFSCTVMLDKGVVQSVERMHVRAPSLSIENGQLLFGKNADQANGKNTLRGGHLPSAKLGDTDLALDFTLGANGLVKLDGQGPFLDATAFLDRKNKKTAAQPPLMANLTVDKMRTGPGRMISKVKFTLDRAADGTFNQVALDASAGKGTVSMALKPDESNRMALRLTSDDAGAVFRAFDIYKSIDGGRLLIAGRAPDAGHKTIIIGHAQISDFKIVNAPVLARLLNAISLVGLPQLLNGEGLHFSRLEGDFEWRMRHEGDTYLIKDGRTSGASLGLTFAGTVDKGTNVTDIGGTIVPISGVNGLIGHIPVIGDILTGGGALFAFTYTVKGPSDNPSVSVNPLSALAPGFLRNIFFATK